MAKKNQTPEAEITSDDLQKSLDKLEEYATSDDPVARKDALLAKAGEGDLEKAERDELFDLLGGTPATEPETPTVGEDLVKSMTDVEGPGTQEALDVSPYLREQHEAMVKSLQSVGDYIEKSDKRQHEHSLMQSKALVEMGHLVKGMSERLETIESQPVRGPKSRGVTADQTLTKSFVGDESGGEQQLSKSEISDALDGIMAESMENGRNGLTKSGEDILLEISKFEQSSKISPSMHGEVKGFIGRRNAAH
jgi:hypothetical protein